MFLSRFLSFLFFTARRNLFAYVCVPVRLSRLRVTSALGLLIAVPNLDAEGATAERCLHRETNLTGRGP